ncbi:MAG: 16S rRNA (cytosine(1402)-N(4))-methyltransferase RsmH [Eubacteriales bacterium]|nr:16S rRNA (cytosine(1402)-N(4))-methyltransferase RsmH [Eubacteriales bacterium]
MEFKHYPVMLFEVIDGLKIRQGGIYVDGTVGGGGHSLHIIKNGGRVIGIDKDKDALKAASGRLGEDAVLVHDDYNNIKEVLKSLIIEKIDGALLDLGVSSYQLDTPERGFSYRFDAPLDMRMNVESNLSAKKIVNEFSASQLERIMFEYGEEPYARAIARKICERRKIKPIETTFELTDVIKSAIAPKVRWEGKHPAKRVFQAIRIAVNDELSRLEKTIEDFCDALNGGGRLAIITFHSLEDRIVKTAFANLAKGCICPKEFPICVCNNKPKAKVITKKPIIPSKEELEQNQRSASAKLRILEKI